MSYLLGNGRVCHSRSTCRRSLQPALAISPEESKAWAKCKSCFVSRACMLCLEDGPWLACPCAEHALCPPCFEEVCERECALAHRTSMSQTGVQCPCQRGDPFPWDMIPRRVLQGIFLELRNRVAVRASKSRAAFIEDDVLTLLCPHCGCAFSDFDGCLAVQCTCRAFFCALCLHACEDNDDAHAHILTCSSNVNRSYFMPFDTWMQLQRQRQHTRLGEVLAAETDPVGRMHLVYQVHASVLRVGISTDAAFRSVSVSGVMVRCLDVCYRRFRSWCFTLRTVAATAPRHYGIVPVACFVYAYCIRH